MTRKQRRGPHDIDILSWMPRDIGVTPDSTVRILRSALPAAARRKRRKPGPRPTADWKNRLTQHVKCLQGSEKQIPTAAKLAQWCGANLGYTPDVSEINKLLRTLLD
jgi:hypothetical protein